MRPTIFLFLAVLVIATSASRTTSAQTVVLPANIIFAGAPAYPAAELLAFTGLKPGASIPQADLQQAAQNLSDTGLFADIRFFSTPAGLTFNLTPMQAEFVLPARFSNLLFWTQPELLTQLQTRVPLFHGLVPVKGNLQDKIIAALQSLLAEKGIANAQVIAIPNNDPGIAATIAFAISTPDVLVHTVTLQQATPDAAAKMSIPLENLAGKPYEEGQTQRAIADTLSGAFRNLGFLDATVSNLEHATPQITPQAINVDFTATISQGELYHLASITWPGSPILTTGDFDKRATIHSGDVASLVSIRSTLRLIAVAYYRKGYQDAKISAPETRDPTNHTVSYTASVTPGEQYRVHAIKTTGLSPEQQKDFDATWKMVPGEFYDVDYSNQFLLARNLPKSLLGYSGKWKAISDPNTHLVDLNIAFTKGGTLVEVR